MQPDLESGPRCLLSLPAIAAVLALHGAVLAAFLMETGARPSDGKGESAVTVRVLDAPSRSRAPPQEPIPPEIQALPPKAPPPPLIASAQYPDDSAPATAIHPPPSAATGAAHDEALSRYAALIWERIALHKPSGITQTGTARLRFMVDGAGKLTALTLEQSSGDAALDAAALAAICAAAPFPPPPPGLTPEDLTFAVPFAFGYD